MKHLNVDICTLHIILLYFTKLIFETVRIYFTRALIYQSYCFTIKHLRYYSFLVESIPVFEVCVNSIVARLPC